MLSLNISVIRNELQLDSETMLLFTVTWPYSFHQTTETCANVGYMKIRPASRQLYWSCICVVFYY